MNILLDTNIIIPLEDTSKVLGSSFAELRKLSAEQQHCLYIHPIQVEDIQRDKDQERKRIVLSRLKQYSQIENPPVLTDLECQKLGLTQNNDNDRVDNHILFALYRGAAHLLVTNDEGIHRKASRLGIQDKVYRLGQVLHLLRRYSTQTLSLDYTGVKERFLYEIDKDQPFLTLCADPTRALIIGFKSVLLKNENVGALKITKEILLRYAFINMNKMSN